MRCLALIARRESRLKKDHACKEHKLWITGAWEKLIAKNDTYNASGRAQRGAGARAGASALTPQSGSSFGAFHHNIYNDIE